MVLKHFNRKFIYFIGRQRMTMRYQMLNKVNAYQEKIPNEDFARGMWGISFSFTIRDIKS